MGDEKVFKTAYIMVKMEPSLKADLDRVAKEQKYGSTAEMVRRLIVEKISDCKQIA